MKKSLSLLLALAMVLGMFASVASADDSALTTEQKYQQLVDSKVLKGTTDGKSHLEDNLTRAEFATIAVAIAGLEEDTASASAFADVKAGQWWTGAITAANKAGLVNGVGNGLFSPKANVTVQEAIKVAALIAKLTPVEGATVDGAADWAAPYIKAAQAANLPLPTNYKEAATRGQTVDIAFAVFQATAAPKVSDVVATVNNDNTVTVTGKVTGTADSVKVTVGTNAAAAATLNADGTFTYKTAALAIGDYSISVIAYNGTTASVPATATAKIDVFGVTSVQALSATQVAVTFSKAVDSTDGAVATHYSINNVNPASASLSSDGKTATLTFANATEVELTDGVFVVTPIKLSGNGDVTSAKYTQVFTYEDKTNPDVASVEAKTKGAVATQLKVTFSEPIHQVSVKIDGSYYSPDAGYADTSSLTVSNLNLDASKPHTVDFINLVDEGGNISVIISKTFNVTVDTSAPVASLSSSSDKTILVTFSKSMNVASVQSAFNTNVGVKDEAYADVLHAQIAQVNGSDKEFSIQVNSTLYANSASRTLTLVFPSSIVDSLGNQLAATTQTVTLNKDTVKPASTSYKVVKNSSGNVTQLIVNFSEALLANANPAEPTIVDSNGVNKTGAFLGTMTAAPVVLGDKAITYNFSAPAAVSGVYAFSFPAGLVSDQAETANTSDAFGLSVDFGSSATTTFNVSSAIGASNVLTVTYENAVKGGAVANSATDLMNYTVAGKPLPSGTTITLDSTQKIATITLPAEAIATTDNNAIITVMNVKSLNGESLNAYTGTVAVIDNTKPVMNSAVLNSDGSITIGFSEALGTAPALAPSDLVLTVNGAVVNAANYTVTAVTAGADKGKYLLELPQANLPSGVTGSLANASAYSIKVATASAPAVKDTSVTPNTLKAGTEIVVK